MLQPPLATLRRGVAEYAANGVDLLLMAEVRRAAEADFRAAVPKHQY
jgi:hypothetical protein